MKIRIPYNLVNIITTDISTSNCYGLPIFSLVSILNIIGMILYAFLFYLTLFSSYDCGINTSFGVIIFRKYNLGQLHNMIFVGIVNIYLRLFFVGLFGCLCFAITKNIFLYKPLSSFLHCFLG